MNSCQMFTLANILQEHLSVDIIAKLPGEPLNISHNLQQIHALLQGLDGQVVLHGVEAVPPLRHQSHLPIGHPVVQRHCCHIVEGLGKVVSCSVLYGYHRVHDGYGFQVY